MDLGRARAGDGLRWGPGRDGGRGVGWHQGSRSPPEPAPVEGETPHGTLGVVVYKNLATKYDKNQKWPEMGLFWSKIDDLEAEKMKMIRGVRF